MSSHRCANRHLLIVEDDAALNQMLGLHFEEQGYTVSSALSMAEALEKIAATLPNVVLLDHRLPDGAGLDLLVRLRQTEPDVAVIMITGMHDLDLAIQAIQNGAYGFIYKPIRTEELGLAVARALEHQKLVRQVDALRSEVEQPVAQGEMIGQSRAMLKVSKDIALVAGSETAMGSIRDAILTLIASGERIIRVVGNVSLNSQGRVAIWLDEQSLYNDMHAYTRQVLALSVLISLATAVLVYLALQWLMVRPIRRITHSLVAFRQRPEEAQYVIPPSARRDEIGVMERRCTGCLAS